MSTAGTTKPWYNRDFFEWLGWRSSGPVPTHPNPPRNPLGMWDGLIMANTAARREAKGALFGELAEAVRQKMPLDQALAHASQTLDETKRRKRWSSMAPGAETRHRPLDMLIAVLMTVIGHLGFVFYGLLALRMTDVERISRLLALRLYRYVVNGHSLSEAMRRCTDDYDNSEIQMIEASEQWGTLADGLKRLSQFQISENRLTMMGTLALYPFWMGGVLLSIASFVLVFIVPKFKDIYDQLGAELPAPTQLLVDLGTMMVSNVVGLLFNFVLLASLLFFLMRGVMNGTRMTKLLLTIFFAVSLASFLIEGAMALLIAGTGQRDNQNASSDPLIVVGAIAICALFVPLIMPYLLAGMESFVLRMERRFRPLLRFIPVANMAVRVEQQARWLGALALGLSSGVTPDKALRSAGKICDGRLERRSFKAAELVAAGHPIGAACVMAKVLDTKANYRLALLDGRPDYLEGLRSIADDSTQNAYEWLQRSGRITEVFMIVALGIVAGMFAIALYLPLFNIPKIVGVESGQVLVAQKSARA